MKVKTDEALEKFLGAPGEAWFTGARIKSVRDQPLTPGGRTRLTLFERADASGRAHPRMQLSTPPATDPDPREPLLDPSVELTDRASFTAWVEGALRTHARYLAGDDLARDHAAAQAGSERFLVNSVRGQRVTALFRDARARLGALVEHRGWDEAERVACERALAVLEDEAYAGDLEFDDGDTGTYHSYGKDHPFVHYLERILDGLPREGSKPFVALEPAQQLAVRSQRDQARRHLDYLMRHKYAYEGVRETDIERSVGGFLIDRRTRNMVSETPDSAAGLVPAYELLRVKPGADRPDAGAYLYRAGDQLRRCEDHRLVEGLSAEQLRRIPVPADRLTFRRAPNDEALRANVRLDWDRNGYVQPGKIGWVGWAGHCDIKAIMESLGLTLLDAPEVHEYRADTGSITRFTRAHLIEMIASVMELGSVYQYADGGGTLQRGVHHFGGFRNDSRPDRIQFRGRARGEHFRWPLSGRQDVFVVKAIETAEGERLNMDTVFFRNLPDLEAIDFAPNPRFLKTVEGDYNLIDVTGHLLHAVAKVDEIDAGGYPVQRSEAVTIDLRADAEQTRYFLGTHIKDAAKREIYRLYLDRAAGSIVAELFRWTLTDGAEGFTPTPLPGESVTIPLASPVSATLSREMKRDDPSAFRKLLELAARTGQSICADTDMDSEVWNGVVTHIQLRKRGANEEAGVEHWEVHVKARFGEAGLKYLVRRDARGEPFAWCPAIGEETRGMTLDFLWQDFPDVASKGIEDGEWVVNKTMLERGLVELRNAPHEEGGFYVTDDHIKNVFELIFSGLAGYRHTIVHNNKRYGFKDEAAWREATRELRALRDALQFEGPGADDPWPPSTAPEVEPADAGDVEDAAATDGGAAPGVQEPETGASEPTEGESPS